MNVRRSVVVSGRVQGVAYRNSTQNMAIRLGVCGWVRNLPNGDVEGCFEGNEGAVLELIDWCRRGSAAARVDRVAVTDGAFTGEFGSFQIRH